MPRKSNPPIARTCEVCGAVFAFRPTPDALRRGEGRYCSRSHANVGLAMRREANPRWKGEAARPQSGYQRARAWFAIAGRVCAECEAAPATERHHWDGDPLNNAPLNIVFVCDACHGRWHRQVTCLRGHPLWGDNLYVDPKGGRACRACIRYWAAERRRKERERYAGGMSQS